MASSLQNTWNRIQNAIRNDGTSSSATFNPPASESDIEELELKINLVLPEDLKDSLRIHNGMEYLPNGEVLSTQRIYDEWKVWTDLLEEGSFDDNLAETDSSVKKCWWNKKWIPIVADGGGNGECLDLDPGETGTLGQVIFMDHEDGERPVRGRSFAEWLEDIATKLESGELYYSDED